MGIPLVDLKAAHAEIADEVLAGVNSVMERCAFILGPEVADFEREMAEFSGVGHCIGVANGTDAIELALRSLEIGPGDEVVLPANTFIATALAVHRSGATPVLVDCDAEHQLIDPALVPSALSEKTRVLLPVHLFGQAAPMAPLVALAKERGLAIVEDAAQAHGATQNGVPVGRFGSAAGMSFYPGKNLGAYGDGGAVLTDDAETATRLRHLRNWGSEIKYEHPMLGFNSRLDTMQAVVLRAKLRRLAAWNEARRQAATRYAEMLADVDGITLPGVIEGNVHVWHLYVIRVPERDRVLSALHDAGVGAGIHYPKPIHLQGAFAHLGQGEGSFPVAEQAAKEILSLPLFPQLTEAQQVQVVKALRAAL